MVERLLRKNATARLLSIVLAIVLWFYVVSEQNPTVTRTFEVPIQVRSLDPDMAVVSIDPETVTITVEGPSRLIDGLDGSDFVATINLAEATPGPVVASVRVAVPKAVQLLGVAPAQVISLVEPVAQAKFPVEVAVTGKVAPDFRAGAPRIVPAEVVVRGGASLVARVERVVTNIDIGGARATVQERLALYAIDASGRQVADVQVLPRMVTVTLPVEPLPPLAALPVKVQLEGTPATGFELAGAPVARPTYVLVRAPSSALRDVDQVLTEPVDVGGQRSPVQRMAELVLPEGVELVGPAEVLVYVPIREVGQ